VVNLENDSDITEEAHMKTLGYGTLLASLLVAAALVGQRSYAETRSVRSGRPGTHTAEPSSPEVVRIRKLTGLNREGVARTPEYQQNSGIPSIKRPQDWVEIKLEYDTKPAWIDELSIQFFVLTEYEVKGKFLYVLNRKTLRSTDVEQANGHLASVYLPPNAVKRYGYPTALAVEVSIDGKVVATLAQLGEKKLKLPADWWKNDTVVKGEGVSLRDEGLLTRDRSPFALTAIDDYEVLR
jgi:hypothetical protein